MHIKYFFHILLLVHSILKIIKYNHYFRLKCKNNRLFIFHKPKLYQSFLSPLLDFILSFFYLSSFNHKTPFSQIQKLIVILNLSIDHYNLIKRTLSNNHLKKNKMVHLPIHKKYKFIIHIIYLILKTLNLTKLALLSLFNKQISKSLTNFVVLSNKYIFLFYLIIQKLCNLNLFYYIWTIQYIFGFIHFDIHDKYRNGRDIFPNWNQLNNDENYNKIFVGPTKNSIIYLNFHDITNKLNNLGEKLGLDDNSSTAIRHSYLGNFFINNIFYDQPLLDKKDRIFTLSANRESHIFLRKWVEELFGPNGNWDISLFNTMIIKFLNEKKKKGSIRIPEDIHILTTKILYWIHFQSTISETEINYLHKFKEKLLMISMSPKSITKIILRKQIKKLSKEKNILLEKYKQNIIKLYPEKTKNLNPNELHLLSNAFMDSLFYAGGLSLQLSIHHCLAILYCQSFKHIMDKYDFNKEENILALVLESIRLFPPVGEISYFDKTKNKHIVCNLSMAGKDPQIWSSDSHKFKLRSKKMYDKFLVSWAEPSKYSGKYAQNNHVCPAKDLSIQMIVEFLKIFIPEMQSWYSDHDHLIHENINFPAYSKKFILKYRGKLEKI